MIPEKLDTILDTHTILQNVAENIAKIIVGKKTQIDLALTCLLANGHLLIEDLPGVGKTTLSLAMAKTFGQAFQRIQFTNDLLPADILGISIYDNKAQEFQFHYGPIFTQVLLADEINRATPRTQSALLEAMEEKQVTLDGKTHDLPNPFFVIATQNSEEQIGTFPLPESQMDRFLMQIEIGYPAEEAEKSLLLGKNPREKVNDIKSVLTTKQLLMIQNSVDSIHISDKLLAYLIQLIRNTRNSSFFTTGLSPRAGLSLQKCARAWAMLKGRDHVLPEDVQAIFPYVAMHRLTLNSNYSDKNKIDILDEYIKQVAV